MPSHQIPYPYVTPSYHSILDTQTLLLQMSFVKDTPNWLDTHPYLPSSSLTIATCSRPHMGQTVPSSPGCPGSPRQSLLELPALQHKPGEPVSQDLHHLDQQMWHNRRLATGTRGRDQKHGLSSHFQGRCKPTQACTSLTIEKGARQDRHILTDGLT